MRKERLLDIDLRLFDGAAGDGGGVAGTAGTGADGAAQAVESALPKAETKRSGSGRRGKSGEFDNVVFGKQAVATAEAGDSAGSAAGGKTGEGNAENDLEARRRAFRERISGEDKDLFQEEFQKAFNRRFKENKGLEETVNAQKPIMDMLMQRYKVEDGDVSKLQKALEEDKTYWEAAAEEAGYTVEQYKAVQKLERENAEFQRRERMRIGQEQARQQMAKWQQEGEEAKALYHSFNLQTELNNPQFRDLLKAKIPVKTAYEVVHMQEINNAAARSAAQAMEQQMTARVKAKAARPTENGTSSQSAAVVKDDVSQLTSREVLEVARRVRGGAKVTFG